MTAHVRPDGGDEARGVAATVETKTARRIPPLGIAAAGALLLVLFHPILAVRAHFYLEQSRYSHCLLLPVVSAVWIWEGWDALRAVPRAPAKGPLVAAVLSVLAFLYGRVQGMNLLQHVAFLGAVAGTIGAFWGGTLLRRLAFPLGYLLLTIPLPKTWDDAITLPLQSVATGAAETVFDALGWIVVRQGNVLHLPGLKLLVEDACSGIHSLYALLALGVAFVAFVDRPTWLRVTLVAATVPIAVTANALRVITTGILAYRVDPSYAQGLSHEATGMIVFGTGLVLLLVLDWCLRTDARTPADAAVPLPTGSRGTAPAPGGAPPAEPDDRR